MPDDAALVVAWCRQAKRRGALTGDLCMAQEYADLIAERAEAKRVADARRAMHDHMDELFEAWLSIEHHEVWEESSRRRKAQENAPEIDLQTVSADTMEGLLAKLRAATA